MSDGQLFPELFEVEAQDQPADKDECPLSRSTALFGVFGEQMVTCDLLEQKMLVANIIVDVGVDLLISNSPEASDWKRLQVKTCQTAKIQQVGGATATYTYSLAPGGNHLSKKRVGGGVMATEQKRKVDAYAFVGADIKGIHYVTTKELLKTGSSFRISPQKMQATQGASRNHMIKELFG